MKKRSASTSLRRAKDRYGRTLVASDWQTKLAKTLQGPLQCIMFYAKKAESLVGGRLANRGSLDHLRSKWTPNDFGPDDLEEDAPTAERNRGPMFNIAEHVTTLDTKTVTLWMAQNWVADDGGVPQLQRGERDVHSREGRLGGAQGPQVGRLGGGCQFRPGGLKLDGLGALRAGSKLTAVP